MKPLVIGILPQEQMRERVLQIARGERKPKPGEPRVWFTSMRSLAEVLSDDNRALLRVISKEKPESIAALAALTRRKPSNLSRTLKTMANYGLVDLKREHGHAPDCQGNRVSDTGVKGTRAEKAEKGQAEKEPGSIWTSLSFRPGSPNPAQGRRRVRPILM